MGKPTLHYVQYPFGELYVAQAMMERVTGPLARSGRLQFKPDSEILDFFRSTFGGPHIGGYIAPINENGKIGPTSIYFHHGLDRIHPRTKEMYLDLLSKNGTLWPESPFPLPSDWKENGGKSFAEMMETFMRANPDPYPRLAVLHADEEYKDAVLRAFLSIATDLAEPVEIKPKSAGSSQSVKMKQGQVQRTLDHGFSLDF